jgi:EthD domain
VDISRYLLREATALARKEGLADAITLQAAGAEEPLVRRYIESHTRLAAYEHGRTPVWDGCALAWFDSVDAIREWTASADYAALQADAPNFLAPGRQPLILTREHVIAG